MGKEAVDRISRAVPAPLHRLGLPVLAFAFGFGVSHRYVGQFAAFDATGDSLILDQAWKLVTGQMPFVDFMTIQELTAALVEALFIAVFYRDFATLALHPSVVNGLAAVLVYAILRMVDAGRWVSFAFAVLTAIVFYPPEGLAFAVQDGVLFAYVALVLGLWTAARRLRAFALLGAGPGRISSVGFRIARMLDHILNLDSLTSFRRNLKAAQPRWSILLFYIVTTCSASGSNSAD